MDLREPDLRRVSYHRRMRFGVALLTLGALAGCPVQGDDCNVDNECQASDVCARDHTCVPPSEVRATRTTWSFGAGMPADEASCEVPGSDPPRQQQLQIIFADPFNDQDKLGFVPVPCATALFSVDKLPNKFTRVRLNIEGGDFDGRTLGSADFDGDGLAEIELDALPQP
jgi:hypothetical protein